MKATSNCPSCYRPLLRSSCVRGVCTIRNWINDRESEEVRERERERERKDIALSRAVHEMRKSRVCASLAEKNENVELCAGSGGAFVAN